jgi:hypothetical protein
MKRRIASVSLSSRGMIKCLTMSLRRAIPRSSSNWRRLRSCEPRCGACVSVSSTILRTSRADAGHREESVDEGSWVVVLSIQLPRCEGHRSPGVLGCTAALIAAFLCASAFIATARAEDSPPPASDGAASSSDSTTTSGATTEATDTSGATTEATDTPGTTTEATDTSGATTEATDTSGATTEATDTSGATTEATDTSGTTTEATDTSGATTEATDTSGATTEATDASGATTEATDTSGAPTDTAGATPSDTSGGVEGQAPDSTNEAASASTDAGASTDTSAPSTAGAPTEVAAPSSAATGSTESAPPASPPAPADRDETTIEPLVPTFRLAPETGAVGLIRRAFDCRVIVVCGLAPLTRAPSDSERVLFGRCPPQEPTKAGQPGARSGEGSGRPNGAQRPSSPRPPAPDHQPQGPSAPGSLLGFSSSGGSGFHSGAVLGLTGALLSLTPPEGRRLVTPLERRRRALLLVFSLERPG